MNHPSTGPCVLTLNGGSASLKFAVYTAAPTPERTLHGMLERLGETTAQLTCQGANGAEPSVPVPAQPSAAEFLVDWLAQRSELRSLVAVGHRVVHGMLHSEPEELTPELLAELRRIQPYDPEHLPLELELIEAVRARFPQLRQLACFDTAFHHGMPRVATQLPIPRRYEAKGVRRYGFHGLSYAYLMSELERLGDPAAQTGRVILAHLGSGASLAAVRDGRSIDTSMGFSPTSGLVMGTRSGDLDPGIAPYLSRSEHLSVQELSDLFNHDSGLRGVSGVSSDVRELLAREAGDVRAREALALFCYQAKKWLGGFAAALGGLDSLVFSGGIGEHAPAIRARICDGLGFLGIHLSEARNAQNALVISDDDSPVTVRVIPTDEQRMIARALSRMLQPATRTGAS